MSKLNTHYYDGKLQNTQLETLLNSIYNLSKETKSRAFIELRQKLTELTTFDQEARRNYDIIIYDFHHQNHKNYDHSNNLHADDLLCLISTKNSIDLLELLCLQLKEMTGGMCPQGRTHRLYQIIVAFI